MAGISNSELLKYWLSKIRLNKEMKRRNLPRRKIKTPNWLKKGEKRPKNVKNRKKRLGRLAKKRPDECEAVRNFYITVSDPRPTV